MAVARTGVRQHSGEATISTSSAPQRKQRWLDFMFKVVGPLLSRSIVAVEMP